MENNILEKALEYYNMGFSLFPCLENKTPMISWRSFQQKRASHEQIKEWWGNGKTHPIAIVTGKISGIVVVDIDDTSTGFQNLANYISPDIKTPMCKTPTGGYHLFFKCPANEVRNNAKAVQGCDFRGEGGYVIAAPSFCKYEKGGKNVEGFYEWVTDYNIKDIVLEDLPLPYISFISLRNDNIIGREDSSKAVLESAFFSEGRRDEDIFSLSNALVKGGANPVLIYKALEIIANNCNPPFPEKDVAIKIKSALERSERKGKNLAQGFREWIESAPGHFMINEYYKESAIIGKEDKHAIVVEAANLCKQRIIEKIGIRRGEYRIVDIGETIIDWKNADDKEFPIKLPLNIHNFVKIFPGNIIVLAGASNIGKTSFLLETIRLNQWSNETYYFNSEMGPSELKSRLMLFDDVIKLDAWNFTAIERSSNFSDIIKPGAVNIIDFMEVYDDFWKVGGWIRDIHLKLYGGIAIIAIQKKASTKKETQNYGRGGELTLEKPRLYLAMDRGKIRIVKAKAWRDHNKNPNGLMRKFNIISGWKFIPKNDWEYEEELESGIYKGNSK